MNKSSIEETYFSNSSLGYENIDEINSKFIIGEFQNTEDLEENEGVGFVDPYDSIWLKIATIIVYKLEILSSLVFFAFIEFEKHYGHYRTLINQLLSILYGVVSLLVNLNSSSQDLTIYQCSMNGHYSKRDWFFCTDTAVIIK